MPNAPDHVPWTPCGDTTAHPRHNHTSGVCPGVLPAILDGSELATEPDAKVVREAHHRYRQDVPAVVGRCREVGVHAPHVWTGTPEQGELHCPGEAEQGAHADRPYCTDDQPHDPHTHHGLHCPGQPAPPAPGLCRAAAYGFTCELDAGHPPIGIGSMLFDHSAAGGDFLWLNDGQGWSATGAALAGVSRDAVTKLRDALTAPDAQHATSARTSTIPDTLIAGLATADALRGKFLSPVPPPLPVCGNPAGHRHHWVNPDRTLFCPGRPDDAECPLAAVHSAHHWQEHGRWRWCPGQQQADTEPDPSTVVHVTGGATPCAVHLPHAVHDACPGVHVLTAGRHTACWCLAPAAAAIAQPMAAELGDAAEQMVRYATDVVARLQQSLRAPLLGGEPVVPTEPPRAALYRNAARAYLAAQDAAQGDGASLGTLAGAPWLRAIVDATVTAVTQGGDR